MLHLHDRKFTLNSFTFFSLHAASAKDLVNVSHPDVLLKFSKNSRVIHKNT